MLLNAAMNPSTFNFWFSNFLCTQAQSRCSWKDACTWNGNNLTEVFFWLFLLACMSGCLRGRNSQLNPHRIRSWSNKENRGDVQDQVFKRLILWVFARKQKIFGCSDLFTWEHSNLDLLQEASRNPVSRHFLLPYFASRQACLVCTRKLGHAKAADNARNSCKMMWRKYEQQDAQNRGWCICLQTSPKHEKSENNHDFLFWSFSSPQVLSGRDARHWVNSSSQFWRFHEWKLPPMPFSFSRNAAFSRWIF